MARSVLIDELLITVHVPARLSAAEGRAVRRTLKGVRFAAALERAIQGVLRRYPSLHRARVSLSR